MDLKTIVGLIGKQVILKKDIFDLQVTVLDARSTYGRIEAQVQTPKGIKRWVDSRSLILPGEGEGE